MGADTIARGLATGARTRVLAGRVDVSGGNQLLGPLQASRSYLRLAGVLTADATITLPAAAQVQKIRNDTTGAFALWVRRGASGVPLQIHQNETVEIR